MEFQLSQPPPHRRGIPGLWSSKWPPSGITFFVEDPRAGCSTPGEVSKDQRRGGESPLWICLSCFFWCRTQLAFWVAGSHCQLMLIFSFTSTPTCGISSGLHLIHSLPVFMLGFVLIQRWDLAHGLVELHDVHKDSPLKPVQVLLDAIPSLQSAGHTT